jgi:predicted AlkP superfamily pyrophosphatase or phosphodiesterase
VPVDQFESWRKIGSLTSMNDGLTTQAAVDVIRKHKPNLVAFHLVETDHEQHAFGPQHYMAKAALTDADQRYVAAKEETSGAWARLLGNLSEDVPHAGAFRQRDQER